LTIKKRRVYLRSFKEEEQVKAHFSFLTKKKKENHNTREEKELSIPSEPRSGPYAPFHSRA